MSRRTSNDHLICDVRFCLSIASWRGMRRLGTNYGASSEVWPVAGSSGSISFSSIEHIARHLGTGRRLSGCTLCFHEQSPQICRRRDQSRRLGVCSGTSNKPGLRWEISYVAVTISAGADHQDLVQLMNSCHWLASKHKKTPFYPKQQTDFSSRAFPCRMECCQWVKSYRY